MKKITKMRDLRPLLKTAYDNKLNFGMVCKEEGQENAFYVECSVIDISFGTKRGNLVNGNFRAIHMKRVDMSGKETLTYIKMATLDFVLEHFQILKLFVEA